MMLTTACTAVLVASLLGCSPEASSSPPAGPQVAADDALPTAEALVDAELLSDVDRVAPGQQITLGVRFTIDPAWHMYGDAASDSGNPPKLTWTLPDGARVGDAEFPVAHRYLQPGPLLDHIYEGEATVLVPFTAPRHAAPGDTLTVDLRVDYLVCDEFCLLGSKILSLSLPVSAEPAPRAAAESSGGTHTGGTDPLAAARARLPGPPRDDVQVEWSKQAVALTVPGAARLEFHPSTAGVTIADLAEHGAADGQRLDLPLDPWGPGGDDLIGVLLVTPAGGGPATSHRLSVAGPSSQGR